MDGCLVEPITADAIFYLHLDRSLISERKRTPHRLFKQRSLQIQAQAWEKFTPNITGEYDFTRRLLRRLIPPLRLRGKLIQMKAGRPPELMRFIITLLLLRLPLMTEVTQMRMKRLHKSISRDTQGASGTCQVQF